MSVFVKSTDGLLMHEDFSQPNSLVWTLSPSYMSNVLEFGVKGPIVTEKGLRIKHSNKYVTYLMPEPSDMEEWGCIFSISHFPVSTQDIGGVMVMNTTMQYLECQTFLGNSPSEIVNGDEFMEELDNTVNRKVEEVFDERLIDKLADLGLISVFEGGGEGASGFPTNPPAIPGFDDGGIGGGGIGGFTPGPSIPGMDDTGDTEEEDEEDEEEDEPEEPDTPAAWTYDDTFYRYIKVYKVKHKYYFYASADLDMKHWIEVGNATLETGSRIGLFLYGSDDVRTIREGRFKCNYVDFYASRFINIYGITIDQEFAIYSDGQLVFRTDEYEYQHMIGRSLDTSVINTTELPVPMKNAIIRTYEKNNYENWTGEYHVGDIYGGDVFNFMMDIRVFVNNASNEIAVDQLYDIGTFYKGDHYIKLIIQNCDTEPALGLNIGVRKYSPYFEGEDEVYLAEYQEGIPAGLLEYSKNITLNIHPSESKSLYVKLFENPVLGFDSKANDFRFKIVIT